MFQSKKMARSRFWLLTLVSLGLLGAITFLAYNTFIPDNSKIRRASRAELRLAEPLPSLPTTFEVNVLRTPIFQELRHFGQYPVTPGNVGRSNPFSSVISR
jgi:hypothetical protein